MRRHWQLIAAVLLIAIFVSVTFPFAGFMLNLFAVFLAWSLASLLNLLIASYIVSFLPIQRTLSRLLAIVVVSFLLATSVEAPTIWQRIFYGPRVSQGITRSVRLNSDPGIFVSQEIYFVDDPLESPVYISAEDEKLCECLAWKYRDWLEGNTFASNLGADVAKVTGKNVTFGYRYPQRAVSFEIENKASEGNPDFVDVTIEIRDADGVAASFVELEVPRLSNIALRTTWRNGSNRIRNSYFWENLALTLTHDTFWTPLLHPLIGYYPRVQIRAFLKQAISP